jgi:hypothetical protein
MRCRQQRLTDSMEAVKMDLTAISGQIEGTRARRRGFGEVMTPAWFFNQSATVIASIVETMRTAEKNKCIVHRHTTQSLNHWITASSPYTRVKVVQHAPTFCACRRAIAHNSSVALLSQFAYVQIHPKHLYVQALVRHVRRLCQRERLPPYSSDEPRLPHGVRRRAALKERGCSPQSHHVVIAEVRKHVFHVRRVRRVLQQWLESV